MVGVERESEREGEREIEREREIEKERGLVGCLAGDAVPLEDLALRLRPPVQTPAVPVENV